MTYKPQGCAKPEALSHDDALLPQFVHVMHVPLKTYRQQRAQANKIKKQKKNPKLITVFNEPH